MAESLGHATLTTEKDSFYQIAGTLMAGNVRLNEADATFNP